MSPHAFSDQKYDALIVGARCAGAATAMLLARAGARVLVIDRAPPGSDTLSTHALMRPAVVQLHRWGVLPALIAAGTPTIRRTTFVYGAESVSIDIKPRGGVDGLYAPRRTVLDRLLVGAARAAGVAFRFGVRFDMALRAENGRVCGAVLRDRQGRLTRVTADLLIGADGRASSVAEAVGADTYVEAAQRGASVYGYFAGFENEGYRWHYQEGVSSGAIATNDGLTAVFATVPAERAHDHFRADALKGLAAVVARSEPALAEALLARGPNGPLRRYGGAPGHLRQAHGPGWALVGDAGYFKDPITAHGISDALLDAERLARAVLAGDPAAFAAYQSERDRFAIPMLAVTHAIAAHDWSLAQVKTLHRELNDCIKAELAATPTAFEQPHLRAAAATV